MKFNCYTMLQNIEEIRNNHKAKVPCFDFESFGRNGFEELQVSEDCGVVMLIIHATALVMFIFYSLI